MKSFILIFTLLFSCLIINSTEIELEQVQVIHETDDNSFYGLSGITVSEDKYIFISNRKNSSVSKYEWSGKFIKRIGQKGGGPGDFNTPWGIDCYKGLLYVNDGRNNRIVVLNKDLKIKRIIKSHSAKIPMRNFHVTSDLMFIGTNHPIQGGENIDHIKVINSEGNLVNSFFNKVPYWSKVRSKSIEYKVALWGSSILCMDIDRSRGKIVVTQETPNNPAVFYIFSSSGKYLREFKYDLEKGYSFPEPKIIRPSDDNYPKYNPKFMDIFFTGNNILTRLYIVRKIGNQWEPETKLILFNQKGDILGEKILPKEKLGIKLFLTNDQHLVMYTITNEEDYVIKIYKLKLPG